MSVAAGDRVVVASLGVSGVAATNVYVTKAGVEVVNVDLDPDDAASFGYGRVYALLSSDVTPEQVDAE